MPHGSDSPLFWLTVALAACLLTVAFAVGNSVALGAMSFTAMLGAAAEADRLWRERRSESPR